jgi:hypothetical protein
MVALSSCVGLMEPRRDLARIGPSASSSGGSLFYPLEVGNHWEYQNDLTLRVTPTDPSLPPDEQHVVATLQVDLTGTEDHGGLTYVVQREGDGTSASQFLYRQDRSGLFNLDAAATQTRPASWSRTVQGTRPSLRAAVARVMATQSAIRAAIHGGRFDGFAGAAPGEITILRYPLAPSKSWHVREDPLFVYTVEKQEGLDLPAGAFNGWRIRIDSDLFGANDRVHVWYGRDGLLRLDAHVEGTVTDENGNVTGTVVSDQVQALADLSRSGGL